MRRRPPKVDREAIVAAAIALGPNDISMRQVARALGVGASTLYYHFESKEELEAEVAEHVVARFRLELSGDWVAAVRRAAFALRALLESEAGIAETALKDPRWGPTIARLNDEATRFFHTHGFAADDAYLAVRAIADFVEAFVVRTAAEREHGVSALRHAVELEDVPALAAARRALGSEEIEQRFLFTLDCLIDGLRKRRAPKTRP